MSRHPDSRRSPRVNYRPGIPRYLQIADAIRLDLRDEGERISSEHALCKRFNVSRPTIRQALDVLVEEGLLYRHAGRGTFSTPSAGADPQRPRAGPAARLGGHRPGAAGQAAGGAAAPGPANTAAQP